MNLILSLISIFLFTAYKAVALSDILSKGKKTAGFQELSWSISELDMTKE